mgnify:CR=1 FL=1
MLGNLDVLMSELGDRLDGGPDGHAGPGEPGTLIGRRAAETAASGAVPEAAIDRPSTMNVERIGQSSAAQVDHRLVRPTGQEHCNALGRRRAIGRIGRGGQ